MTPTWTISEDKLLSSWEKGRLGGVRFQGSHCVVKLEDIVEVCYGWHPDGWLRPSLEAIVFFGSCVTGPAIEFVVKKWLGLFKRVSLPKKPRDMDILLVLPESSTDEADVVACGCMVAEYLSVGMYSETRKSELHGDLHVSMIPISAMRTWSGDEPTWATAFRTGVSLVESERIGQLRLELDLPFPATITAAWSERLNRSRADLVVEDW